MADDGNLQQVGRLFRLLGNETRMLIMRALWEGFDFEAYVTESREGTPFSELLEATGVEDSGNFNYHLGELAGVLVEDRDDGYVLTPLGYNLMRSIERYAAFEYVTVDEGPLDERCPFCAGTLVGEYRREVVSVRCRDCDGLGSDGNFTFVEVPVTGARELSMPDLLDVATLAMFSKVTASSHGFCWECRAGMDRSLEHCDDHERTETSVCDSCEQRYEAKVHAECPECGTSGRGPVLEYAIVDPAVAAFFGRNGAGPRQVGPWRYRLRALEAATETITATDPLAVEATFSLEGETHRVTVGADLSVGR